MFGRRSWWFYGINNKFRNCKNDKIGITLKSVNRDIPGWVKSSKFIKKHNINITYGIDGTGNLYNINNIKYLKIFLKKG